MRVDGFLALGPLKNSEAPVVRSDQRHRVALILHELGSRKVPGSAELLRMDEGSHTVFNGLRHSNLFDQWRALPAGNLRAKAEQLILIGEHHGAIDRSE